MWLWERRAAKLLLYPEPELGDWCAWVELSEDPLDCQDLKRESLLLDPLLSAG